ncbi:MAG: glutathione S-transferase family protein [Betaproteobacteria bacterium]
MSIRLFELAGADPARRYSPYCWRTCLALAHKGLEWETIPWRFADGERIAPYGSRTVPVLLDGDRAVVDSWVIAAYLDSSYGERPPLFDSDAARAEGLLIKFWVERTLNPLITRMVALDILDIIAEGDRQYFRESREKRLGGPLEQVVANRDQTLVRFREALEPLRAMLDLQPFVGGAAANYADYTVFGTFMWARGVSPFRLLAPDDLVHAWRERMLDLFGGLARRATGFPV